MRVGEGLGEGVFALPPRFPPRCDAAEAFARWGTVSHRLGHVLAAVFLVMAGAFVALTPEPLGQRAMTFVLFGTIPALGSYLGGWIALWVLRGAGGICDWIAATLDSDAS
jgi:hypothetical protein